MLQRADREPAEDVHAGDQQARHRVAPHELRGTVHRAVEVGLLLDALAPPARLGLVDQARVQVGVDRHLLAGHGVEGEAGRDLGDAAGALGDHDEVDDHEEQEDHDADDEAAADHELAEGLDHRARRSGPAIPVQQDQTGRRDVQRQAEEGGEEQDRRERPDLERVPQIERDHEHHEREREVHREAQIEHDRRKRDEQHRQDHDHTKADHRLAHGAGLAALSRHGCGYHERALARSSR